MNLGKTGAQMSPNGVNSQALKRTSSQLKSKRATKKTYGHPYATPFSDNSSASKNTFKRYTEEELCDCKAGIDATRSVGVLKPLIQIGSLPWNPLVWAITSKSKEREKK